MTVFTTPDLEPFTEEQLAQRIFAFYEAAGFTKTNKAGDEVPDEDALKRKAFETVQTREATGKADRSAKSWTEGELYAAVLPGAPGTEPGFEPNQLSLLDQAVYKTLKRRVWNLTNPARTGYIQKRLGDIGSKVLCRGKVMRDLDEVSGCFITDDPELILSDSLQPQVESMVRQAQNLSSHATMITGRHPEIEDRVVAILNAGIKRTRAALPEPRANSSRPQRAIGAGGEN